MAFLNPTKDIRRPDLSRGSFFGYIVDNNDPEKRQRVKIRIPQLHRGISDDDLPWMMPSAQGQNHAGGGVGRVEVPPNNALMEVKFEEDDPHSGRYRGSATIDEVHKDNELLQEDYPKTVGGVDETGHKETWNKQKKEYTRTWPSGTTLHVDGAGTVSITAASDINFSAKGKINLAADGGMKIHSKQPIDVKGQVVGLNNSGTTSEASSTTPRTVPTTTSRKGSTSL